eukprot:234188-Pyramimonas_sp.AAC.1
MVRNRNGKRQFIITTLSHHGEMTAMFARWCHSCRHMPFLNNANDEWSPNACWSWDPRDGGVAAMDVMAQMCAGHRCDAVAKWMRGQPPQY